MAHAGNAAFCSGPWAVPGRAPPSSSQRLDRLHPFRRAAIPLATGAVGVKRRSAALVAAASPPSGGSGQGGGDGGGGGASRPPTAAAPPSRGGMRLLESATPFAALVSTTRFLYFSFYRVMMAELAPTGPDGDYLRPPSKVRYMLSPATEERGETEGSATPQAAVVSATGPTLEELVFPAAAGRYALYVGGACPWCHRVLLARSLLRLDGKAPRGDGPVLPVRWLTPGSSGLWQLDQPDAEAPGTAHRTLRDVYGWAARSHGGRWRGRATAPMLLDTVSQRVVSNESADILRMLPLLSSYAPEPLSLPGSGAADGVRVELRPAALADLVDELVADIGWRLNQGVYRAGFARTQAAYERAAADVFGCLDELDARLAGSRFLASSTVLTEADVVLFPTVLRFDAVYGPLFKLAGRSVRGDGLRHVAAWLRDVYQLPGVAGTCELDGMGNDYFGSLFPLNPGGIIPVAPDLQLNAPHGRAEAFAGAERVEVDV